MAKETLGFKPDSRACLGGGVVGLARIYSAVSTAVVLAKWSELDCDYRVGVR